jgi:phosphatidate phosphatase APP1
MKKLLLLLLLPFTIYAENRADIQLQTCYGNPHQLLIEGRVLYERKFDESSKDDSWVKNGWQKMKHLLNDEVKNEKLTLTVGEEVYQGQTDEEGYFEFEVQNHKTPWKNHEKIELTLNEYNISVHASAFVVDTSVKVGIISDFDDTVIVSNVTNKLTLIKNTLFKNYKQREVVKGMKRRFETILATPDSPLFFVTGSPKQLYSVIHQFLNYHEFPKRTLITKKAHGDNADPLFDQLAYKMEKIEKLILLYPNIKWVCFGDSGERDQEVYETVAQKYPKKIKEIYIRSVEHGKIKKIFPHSN